jgi:hypothetical protein
MRPIGKDWIGPTKTCWNGSRMLLNDHTLFVGWYDYALATGSLPIEAQVFQVWYFALYPEKLDPASDMTKHLVVFPNLTDLQRSDQKKLLRSAITEYRRDPKIMNDPRTDGRPLTLP